jgi:hypothetical protein
MASLLTIRPESATRGLMAHKRITSSLRYSITLTLPSIPDKSHLQHNANRVQDLPHLQDTNPKSSTPIDGLAATHKVVSREELTLRNQASISSAAKTLGSLVELEQRAATRINAIQDLKNRISALPPTRSLIDEINTHRADIEKMLAILTVLWCHHNSVAMHTKEDLELQLQKGIKDLKQLKSMLTSNPAGPSTCRVIEIEKPSEDLDPEYTMHHTDLKNRRRLHSLLRRLRVLFTAKFIPSACPRLSGPLNSALEQLQAEVLQGRCQKNYG